MEPGKYNLQLLNHIGQVIPIKTMNHAGACTVEKIVSATYSGRGIYKLEITQPGKKIKVILSVAYE